MISWRAYEQERHEKATTKKLYRSLFPYVPIHSLGKKKHTYVWECVSSTTIRLWYLIAYSVDRMVVDIHLSPTRAAAVLHVATIVVAVVLLLRFK